jgi:hypothetical protein
MKELVDLRKEIIRRTDALKRICEMKGLRYRTPGLLTLNPGIRSRNNAFRELISTMRLMYTLDMQDQFYLGLMELGFDWSEYEGDIFEQARAIAEGRLLPSPSGFNYDLIDLAHKEAEHIFGDLVDWAFAGSNAMFIHGIERKCHDVDVVVPVQALNTVIHRIIELGLDVHFGNYRNNGPVIKVVMKSFAMDIMFIEDFDDNVNWRMFNGKERLCVSLENLIEVKTQWARPKDLNDLELIEQFMKA